VVDTTERKCPVCGTKNPQPVTGSLAMYQCGCCKLTDTLAQFPVSEDNPTLDQEKFFTVLDIQVARGVISDEERTQALFSDGAQYPLDEKTVLTTYYPPDDIRHAVEKVEHYFYHERAAVEWAYSRLQSRDPDKHPNLAAAGLTGAVIDGGDVKLSDVRRLAAAFGCVVVPHPSPESELRAAKGALAIILDSPSYRTMEWDALSEISKQRALEIVSTVKSELGFGL